MALEIIDSRYGETKKNLQDLIQIILAKEYPLTIGEIAKRLKSQFKISLTFQAIRKSIIAMKERKILEENNKQYQINKNYILEYRRLSDQFLRNYFTAEKKDELPTEESTDNHTTYEFNNLLQADKFWGEVVLDWARNLKANEDTRFCFHGPHCWYVFGHLGTESDFLIELKENNVKSYYLVQEKTPLDKWTKQFYKDYKVLYKINKSNDILKTATGVFGDFLIQFEYPEDLYNEINKFYQNSNSLASTKLSVIAKLLKEKHNIKLFIIKNKTIAVNMKNNILSNFN